MEESIYRMSLGENFLILIIIGLWLCAVINLARKLERICNPPPIYSNYTRPNKIILKQSTLYERYPKNLIQPIRSSTQHFVRAKSEPTIDASRRTTIHIRSPSETFLHPKASVPKQISSPNVLELGKSNSPSNLPRHSGYRIRVETISDKPIQPQLLNLSGIPPIVRRSFLDLHRRALMSNTSSNTLMNRCIVSTTENQSMITTNRFPLMKTKTYQRGNTINEDYC